MLSAHVDYLGSGPDVVLLHGTAVAPSHMHILAQRLAGTRRVWVAHLPGYGQTPSLQAGHTVEDIRRSVERGLTERGVSEATLVGMSGGAYLAFAMALAGAVRARSVVSLGGMASFTAEHREALRSLAQQIRGGADLPGILASSQLSPGFARAHPESVQAVRAWADAKPGALVADELEAFAGAADLVARLGELDVPIVARGGELDVAAPVAYSEAIVRAARRGTLQRVPGAGHALLVEDLEETAQAVERALGCPPIGV